MTHVPPLADALHKAALRLDAAEATGLQTPRIWWRRGGRLSVAVAALLVAGGGGAIAAKLVSDGSAIRTSKSQAERDYAYSQFSALSDSALQTPAAEAAGRRIAAVTKTQIDPSRSVVVRPRNPTIYLHIGDKTLCTQIVDVDVRGSGLGCGDPYPALGDQGLVGSTAKLARDRTRVTVIAPDRISKVRIQHDDGSFSVLSFKNNVATGAFRSSVRKFIWTDRHGVRKISCPTGGKPPKC